MGLRRAFLKLGVGPLLALAFAVAHAEPVVDSVDGYWAPGNAMTIRGSDFGPVAEVLFWDDFERGLPYRPLDSELPVIGDPWQTIAGQPYPGIHYSSSRHFSGRQSAEIVVRNPGLVRLGREFAERHGELYFSFQRWRQATDNDPVVVDFEQIFNLGLGDQPGSASSTVRHHLPFGACVGYVSPMTTGSWFPLVSPFGRWSRWEVVHRNVTAEAIDWRVVVDGEVRLDQTNLNLGSEPNGLDWGVSSFWIGGMIWSNSNVIAEPYSINFDDIYVAHGQARLEIGDCPDPTLCQARDIMIPTSWSQSAIEFQIPIHARNSGPRYAFVIDAAGRMSPGFLLPTDPPPLPPLPIQIEVNPGNTAYPVDEAERAKFVTVVVYARNDQVDFMDMIPGSPRLGPGGAAEVHADYDGDPDHYRDVDGDGLADLLLHFDAKTAGIQWADSRGFRFVDTKVELHARTWWGQELVGVDHIRESEIPNKGSLANSSLAVAPNPFNPSTTITFGVKEAGPVRLAVFDLAGRLVRTLVDENEPQGSYEAVWDGRDSSGKEVSSGTYLARLEFGGGVETVRMGLVR